MKQLFFLFLLALGGSGYYLHTKDLLDDVPHVLTTLTKPAHEQPVHHFYYGLKSGELLFTGLALDKAGTEQLSTVEDLSPSKKEQLKKLIQYATCQLTFEVLSSNQMDDKAIVNIRINTVHPSKLLKSLAGSTLTNLFAENPSDNILESLKETGCMDKTKQVDQKIELHKEDGAWKICSECAGKDIMLEILYHIVKAGL
jgi:hypothetical protein